MNKLVLLSIPVYKVTVNAVLIWPWLVKFVQKCYRIPLFRFAKGTFFMSIIKSFIVLMHYFSQIPYKTDEFPTVRIFEIILQNSVLNVKKNAKR